MSDCPSPSTKRKLSHTSSFTKMGRSLIQLVRKKSTTDLLRESENSRMEEKKRQSQRILRAAEIVCPINGSDYLNGVNNDNEDDFVKRLEVLVKEEEKLYQQASPVTKKPRAKRATINGLFSPKREDDKENSHEATASPSKSKSSRKQQESPSAFKDSTNKFSTLRSTPKRSSKNNSVVNSPFKTPVSTPQRETQRQASVRALVQALSPNSQLQQEERKASDALEELSKLLGFQVKSIEEAESLLSKLTSEEPIFSESDDEL